MYQEALWVSIKFWNLRRYTKKILFHKTVLVTQMISRRTSPGIIQMTAPDPAAIYPIRRSASIRGYANLIFCYGRRSFSTRRDKPCTRAGT